MKRKLQRLLLMVFIWFIALGPLAKIVSNLFSPYFSDPVAFHWALLMTASFAWGWYAGRVFNYYNVLMPKQEGK